MGKRNEEQKAKHREEQRTYYKKYPDKVRNSVNKWRMSHKDEYRNYYRNYTLGHDSRVNVKRREANAQSLEECNKDKHRSRWTHKEESFLIENYQSKTIKEISIILGRTISSVERKRNRLGLVKEKGDINGKFENQ